MDDYVSCFIRIDLKSEHSLHEAGSLPTDSSLPCEDCYQKIPVEIDRLISHPLSSNTLLLTGSHVIQG